MLENRSPVADDRKPSCCPCLSGKRGWRETSRRVAHTVAWKNLSAAGAQLDGLCLALVDPRAALLSTSLVPASLWGYQSPIPARCSARFRRCLVRMGVEAVRALRHRRNLSHLRRNLAQDPALFRDLARDAGMMLAGQDVQRKIRQRYNPNDAKWYVVRAIGRRAKRPPIPSSFIRFFLHPQLLSIASTYLGLQVRLNYMDVWHNIPVCEGEPPISAELWHRDHEDKRLIKVFVLLSDVDETMGPFTYVKRSQVGGEYGSLFPAIPPTGRYPETGCARPTHQRYAVAVCLLRRAGRQCHPVRCERAAPGRSVAYASANRPGGRLHLQCRTRCGPLFPPSIGRPRTVVPCGEVRPVFLARRYLFAHPESLSAEY